MRTRLLAALSTVGALLALAVPVATPATAAAPAPALPIEVSKVTIPVRDGVTLDAVVAQPTVPGRYPLVVQTGTFGGDFVNIKFIGEQLAAKGYVTVNYTTRGVAPSTGEMDGGGPKDVADVSDVIDWALATRGSLIDEDRIGTAAQSYGGGIGVIAAAFDTRIKAVVNIAGWVNLERAVYQNRTRAIPTFQLLDLVSTLFGKLSPDTKRALQAGYTGEDMEWALQWARERSASHYMDRYRQHAPALYMSHQMNEMMAPIDATMDFFEAYPGPKREQLTPGDHGTTELFTPLHIAGPTWPDAFRWLDHHLKGVQNGIDTEPRVRVQPRSSNGSPDADEFYATTANRATTRQYFGFRNGLLATETTLAAAPGAGKVKLRKGENHLLKVPFSGFSYAGETYTGRPLSANLALIDRGVTGVWQGEKLAATLQYRGSATVHLQITPTQKKGTVVAYLLDVDEFGEAFIIAQAPYSWLDATPGTTFGADIAVPYNAYDLTKGHRPAVAVATGDTSYSTENPDWSTMEITAGSWVDIPLK